MTIGADEHQWGLYRSGNAVSFVHSTKLILARCIREKGIELSPEGRAALDALRRRFSTWRANPTWRGTPLPSGPPTPAAVGPTGSRDLPAARVALRPSAKPRSMSPSRSEVERREMAHQVMSSPARAPSCCCLWSAPTPPHFDPARHRRGGADRPTGPTKPTSDSLCTATPIATRPVRTSSFEKFGSSRWATSRRPRSDMTQRRGAISTFPQLDRWANQRPMPTTRGTMTIWPEMSSPMG